MDLQTLVMALIAVAIPFVVSTYLWPIAQKVSAKVKALPSIIQQLLIMALNAGMAFGAVKVGMSVPALDVFASADMQAMLTGLVGFLSTLIFKNGKAAAA